MGIRRRGGRGRRRTLHTNFEVQGKEGNHYQVSLYFGKNMDPLCIPLFNLVFSTNGDFLIFSRKRHNRAPALAVCVALQYNHERYYGIPTMVQ